MRTSKLPGPQRKMAPAPSGSPPSLGRLNHSTSIGERPARARSPERRLTLEKRPSAPTVRSARTSPAPPGPRQRTPPTGASPSVSSCTAWAGPPPPRPAGPAVAHAPDGAFLLDKLVHLGAHHQLEVRVAFRLPNHELQKTRLGEHEDVGVGAS